jgi:hypothetical protein
MTSTRVGAIVPAAVIIIGKNLPIDVAPINAAFVATDGTLRRQNIHRLGRGNAWHALQTEGRHAAVRASEQVGVGPWLQQPDQHTLRTQVTCFLDDWAADAHQDVGLRAHGPGEFMSTVLTAA